MLSSRTTEDANQAISQPFTEKEVTEAISSMSPLKSPGPDGFPALFYHKYWHIIGNNVITCTLNFLNNLSLPAPLNHTFVVLIPKNKNPERMTEFRPISLCNVIYKIGSKAIANRLKPALALLISPSQSAFVPNRLITDNVLVAFELNHYIRTHTRAKHNFMTLKLDVSKAYDRVEWVFLRKVLLRLGLPRKFVDLIMLTVTSVSFSFLMNGLQFGSLRPARGLRQGDPLSPYLFICVVEAFIGLIDAAVAGGQIRGIQVARSAPSISTLCFADDTMVFCEATPDYATRLKQILDTYARVSGQVINFEKSSMVFSSGIPADCKTQITQILGVQVVDKLDKYLGMPAVVGKSKQQIFGVIRERVWKRINGWGEKTLSQAGKEVLIKAVLQAIPTYLMSCFLLPGNLITSIEAAIREFWWGNGEARKMAWLAWSQLCRSKRQGGLGFRDLRAFNMALLAKQGWRILTNPDSLMARIFEAKYFPHGDFLKAKSGYRPSATWSSILKARDLLVKGIRIRIGNGYSTSIWDDPWLPDDRSFKVLTPRPPGLFYPMQVVHLINQDSGTWNKELIQEILWPIDCVKILTTPIGAITSEDRVIWHYAKNGQFSVKSAYQIYFEERCCTADSSEGAGSGVQSVKWSHIWGLNIPPKVKVFLWMACRNIIPHSVELTRRHVSSNPFCGHCGVELETPAHIFLECRGMREIWSTDPFRLPQWQTHDSVWLLFQRMRAALSPEDFLVGLIMWWKSWEIRNKEFHGIGEGVPSDVVVWSREYLALYHEAQIKPPPADHVPLPSVWIPPDPGSIKVNVDVAFPEGLDSIRVGMVARNAQGVTIWWARKKIVGRPQPSEGEAMAAVFGVTTALSHGWRQVIVETDCLPVHRYLNLLSSPLVSFGAILDSCFVYVSRFNSLTFSFVRRSGNSLAHSIVTATNLPYSEGPFLPSVLME